MPHNRSTKSPSVDLLRVRMARWSSVRVDLVCFKYDFQQPQPRNPWRPCKKFQDLQRFRICRVSSPSSPFFSSHLDVHLPCVAARPISALGCGQSKTARGQVSWHRFTLVHIGWHVRDTEESLVGDGGRWRKPHRNDLTAPSPRALTEFPECFVACLPESHKAPRAPGHPLPSWHVLKRLDVTDVSKFA